MANIKFLDAGGASTEGLHFYVPDYSTATIDKTVKPAGAYSSWLLGDQDALVTPDVLGGAGRISFYFRTNEFNSIDLLGFQSNVDNQFLWLVGREDGLLEWEPYSGARTTGTHYLQPNTWHRISVAYNFNGTNNNLSAKVYLDGQLDITATGQNTGIHTDAHNLSIANGTFQLGQSIWIAHLYIDDGDDLSDTGDIRTTAKLPTANRMWLWTSSFGAEGAINSRPLDEGTGISDMGGTSHQNTYDIQAANVGDVDLSGATIHGYMGWLWAKMQDVVEGTPKLILNGVEYPITLTTSPAIYYKPITSSEYPNATAKIGATGAGSNSYETVVYEMGVVVAYTPAQITFLEAAGASTGDMSVWDSTDSPDGFSISTTVKPPGAYSSIQNGDGDKVTGWDAHNTIASGVGRISFYWRQSAVPSAGQRLLLTLSDNPKWAFALSVYVRSDGVLSIVSGSGFPFTDGDLVTEADRWYRISLAFRANGTDDIDAKLYVDGIEEVSVTGYNTGGLTPAEIQSFGSGSNGAGDTRLSWFAHYYVDDGSDLTDTGDKRTTAKFPTDTILAQWIGTIGDGSVDERPLSELAGVDDLGVATRRQTYEIQALAVGDVDLTGATIHGHMGWAWAKQDAVSGTPALIVDGIDYGITLTTSPAIYRKVVTSGEYPTAIGMRAAGTSDPTYAYEMGMVIAYTPSEQVTQPKKVNQQMFNMWS